MTTFVYTAKKDTAETVTGQIAARNQEEAIDIINQLGLLPVSVQAESTGQTLENREISKPVKMKEVGIFSRQLADLLKSGMPILRALIVLQEQSQNSSFRTVIFHIATDIQNGKSFSECLTAYPRIFSSLYVTMVHAGEESGNLQGTLSNLAWHQRKQEKILSRVRMALAYPGFMAVVGVLTVCFLLTFVMPKMTGLFTSLEDTLPLPTLILLKISGMLSKYWFFILLALAGIGLGLRQWMKSQNGRRIWSYFSLRMPLLGEIVLKTELARFCRTLSLLLKSGTPILQALQISVPVLDNELIKRK